MEIWFTRQLLNWYKINKRDLPWRKERDPYKIWLSEIILQQTQVNQGISYYQKFIKAFPKVKDLALASEDEVLKLWQGLGYYSRARNLLETAKVIHFKYKGKIPADYLKIRELKGIGDYTSAAIASFAFDLPYAVLDGNVYRFLSRLFGIKTGIDTNEGKKEFTQLAYELLNKKEPALHNQAIMEFGSQYCKPTNPNCEACIFNPKCIAFKENSVSQLPFKSKKIKVRNRFFNFIVLVDKNNNITVEKRKHKDIWQGLYQFQLIETDTKMEFDELKLHKEFKSLIKGNYSILHNSKFYKHVLTHQLLWTYFYILKIKSSHPKESKKINIHNLTELAFPRLIELFIDDSNLKELIKFDKN
jgi:A/G-specific adenine glycosylase